MKLCQRMFTCTRVHTVLGLERTREHSWSVPVAYSDALLPLPVLLSIACTIIQTWSEQKVVGIGGTTYCMEPTRTRTVWSPPPLYTIGYFICSALPKVLLTGAPSTTFGGVIFHFGGRKILQIKVIKYNIREMVPFLDPNLRWTGYISAN